MNIETTVLEKYAQVVSSDLMQVLKESAKAKGISLDMEIALRLMTGLVEPGLNKDESLFNQVMRQEFSHEEALRECKHKRESALYLYEMEKLRLFLRFEKNLPRDVKEAFTLIDVKEASKVIKAELEAENKANKEE